jgi:hypothetical protein
MLSKGNGCPGCRRHAGRWLASEGGVRPFVKVAGGCGAGYPSGLTLPSIWMSSYREGSSMTVSTV